MMQALLSTICTLSWGHGINTLGAEQWSFSFLFFLMFVNLPGLLPSFL